MKKLAWLSLVLTAVLALSEGFAAKGRVPVFDAEDIAALDAVLERAVQRGAVPGVVALVANKDRVIYEGAAGLRDVANRQPMPRDAIFRIASMTKPVTAAAVMMLVEEGKLKLDDPVSKFLPQFKDRPVLTAFNADGSFTTRKAKKEVLIRHLMSSTSGLAYSFADAREDRLQKALKDGQEPPLLYEPGAEWTYSGGLKTLGQIVEKLSGKPLDRLFDERIFKPLGLQDTAYSIPAEKMNRVPTTHQRQDGKLVESPNPDKIQWNVVGDGGLNSTARDYAKFLQVFLNEGRTASGVQLLRKKSVDAMTKNQIGRVIVQQQVSVDPVLSRSFPIGAGRDKFGFGWQLTVSNDENPDLRAPGSYSWAGIFNTHFWVDPQRQIAAVIMMQVLPFYDEDGMKVYREFEAAIGRGLR